MFTYTIVSVDPYKVLSLLNTNNNKKDMKQHNFNEYSFKTNLVLMSLLILHMVLFINCTKISVMSKKVNDRVPHTRIIKKLHEDVAHGDCREVQYWLVNLKNLSEKNQNIVFNSCLDGRTLLGIAIENGDEQMVRGLIRQTMIDINNTGQKDETSLVQTLTYQDRRMAKRMTQVLLRRAHSKGLDLTTPHKFTGNTPLHLAIQLQDYDITKELISHNINTDVPNIYGHTPLHLAVIQVYIDGIKLLLQADANMTKKSRAYDTILHTAVKEFLYVINSFISKNISLVFTFPRNNQTKDYNTMYVNPAIEKYLVMFDTLLAHVKFFTDLNNNYDDIWLRFLQQELGQCKDKGKLIKELEGLVNKFDEMDYTTTNLSNTSVQFVKKLTTLLEWIKNSNKWN